MLKSKAFWMGFVAAYVLAFVVPPTRFLKKKS